MKQKTIEAIRLRGYLSSVIAKITSAMNPLSGKSGKGNDPAGSSSSYKSFEDPFEEQELMPFEDSFEDPFKKQEFKPFEHPFEEQELKPFEDSFEDPFEKQEFKPFEHPFEEQELKPFEDSFEDPFEEQELKSFEEPSEETIKLISEIGKITDELNRLSRNIEANIIPPPRAIVNNIRDISLMVLDESELAASKEFLIPHYNDYIRGCTNVRGELDKSLSYISSVTTRELTDLKDIINENYKLRTEVVLLDELVGLLRNDDVSDWKKNKLNLTHLSKFEGVITNNKLQNKTLGKWLSIIKTKKTVNGDAQWYDRYSGIGHFTAKAIEDSIIDSYPNTPISLFLKFRDRVRGNCFYNDSGSIQLDRIFDCSSEGLSKFVIDIFPYEPRYGGDIDRVVRFNID